MDAPDIMPTLLGMCGLDIPDTVEGRNWTAEIQGDKEANPEDAAFLNMAAEFTELPVNDMRAYEGVTNYTYVRNTDGPWLMYDNDVDPYKMNNLINKPEHADLQAKRRSQTAK